MKLQLASKEYIDITTMLNKGDWGDPESPPENLPENMTKPDKRIPSLRARIISEIKIVNANCATNRGHRNYSISSQTVHNH